MRIALVAVIPFLVAVAGCGRCEAGKHACPTAAIAVVQPTAGSQVKGVVRFSETSADSLTIVADLEGLAPNSKHAFHIHEFGDLSAADGMSAGGHYNPAGHQHGTPDPAHHHAGDLGNIAAGADGKAHLELTLKGLTLCGENPVLGRAVVLHEKEDDLTSQPAGNAGPRIAVGVIGVAKTP